MKKYQVILTEEQLMLIEQCVEDCHRFACGQTELWNTTSRFNIKNQAELRNQLQKLQPLVTPELEYRASYDWAGNGCKDKHQKRFIVKTYAIYREILHKIINDGIYKCSTLTCDESGQVPIIEAIEK